MSKERYETSLSKRSERQFWKWLDKQHKSGSIADGDYQFYRENGYGYDYDFRLAYRKGLKPGPEGHWSDIGKKPNHPTFSTESFYKDHGTPGHWEGERFIPGGTGKNDPSAYPSYQPKLLFQPTSLSGVPDFHEAQPYKPQKPQDRFLFKFMKVLDNSRRTLDQGVMSNE